jgi:DNA repair protein RecO (recombination protein O)
MEWEAPGIVLSVRPFGEGDAIASTYTAEQGRHLGLAHGGLSRRRAAVWQPGNLVQLRWVGRLADQLGAITAELVHASAALALDDALSLALLNAACAVADGALPEREPHPRSFALMVQLIAGLLADLGYGLDLSRCAVTGASEDLAFVSPRTGRAVAREASGEWHHRLLPLPAFLWQRGAPAPVADLVDGLRLTGHFLARDAFGVHNRPLPPARLALYDRVVRMTVPISDEDASVDA